MKIIAYDNFKPGVSLDDLKPYLRDEVSNVWRLWKAGVVRENYARADVGGVVIVTSHWGPLCRWSFCSIRRSTSPNRLIAQSVPVTSKRVRSETVQWPVHSNGT